MGLLRILPAAVLLLASRPAAAQDVSTWRPYIAEAAARYAIPAAWIERVMRIESGGRTRIGPRPIVSSAGAMGLMQLMPATWAQMRDAYGLGYDPFDPRDNILAGTAYLRLLYDRFGYPGLFAAYNAGPGRYSLYLAGRADLPGETVRYLAAASRYSPVAGFRSPARSQSIFATAPSGQDRPTAASSPAATLFAIAPRR